MTKDCYKQGFHLLMSPELRGRRDMTIEVPVKQVTTCLGTCTVLIADSGSDESMEKVFASQVMQFIQG